MINSLPKIRGRYSENAPLGVVGWFRTGGVADILYKPADLQDLQDFVSQNEQKIPVTVFGVLSNTIIRDGGIDGVVIRLGREFTGVEQIDRDMIKVGAAALDLNVAGFAAESGIAGLEFLSGVPGTIGGAIVMNAGAYGSEIKDILVKAEFIDDKGNIQYLSADELQMGYRKSVIPYGWIVTGAILNGHGGNKITIQNNMQAIKEKREATQPIRSKTGGSTFANPKPEELQMANLPENTRAWQLVDKVGGRELKIGGAQMSELHANFMINTGDATASDLENLGEEIRRRVNDQFGVDLLHWEIRRVGRHK